MRTSISRRCIFETWTNSNHNSRNETLFNFIISYFDLEDPNKETEKCLKLLISRFISKLNDRWKKCGRTNNIFLRTYSSWLDKDFSLPPEMIKKLKIKVKRGQITSKQKGNEVRIMI